MSTAIWDAREERQFVQYLRDHISEAGDGGSFKESLMSAAAVHIAPFLDRGPVKTLRMCQNKYSSLRRAYRIVTALQDVSGWTWNDKTGASIDEHTASTWDAYIARHPDAKPFRNRGWPHVDDFAVIMPTPSLNNHVFHPTANAAPTTSAPVQDGGSDGEGDNTAVAEPGTVQDDAVSVSDDEDEIAPVIPTGSKRRARATPAPVSKRVKPNSGAAAINTLAASVDNFATAMATAITAPPSSMTADARLSTAIKTAIRLEAAWLSTEELGSLIDCLTGDIKLVDTYLAIEDSEEIRHQWVRKRLNTLLH